MSTADRMSAREPQGPGAGPLKGIGLDLAPAEPDIVGGPRP